MYGLELMIGKKIHQIWQSFLQDNLFRNSIYLMLTTVLMGGFGFFFWIICTHIFTPEQIGLGTTLISAMTLISFISLLGFNSTFVRFLPNSQTRNEEINTGFTLVMLTAGITTIVYIFFIPIFTPQLEFLHENLWYSLSFIIIVILTSINSLTDSIFIAYRKAQYNLLTDGIIISITKLILPLLFVSIGAYGIFMASGLATTIGMLASTLFLIFKFNYRPQIKIDTLIINKLFHYSFTNYIANLLAITPTLILPIIIINHLGASAAGYYYLAFMVINLLYTISASISQSLFAEGSYGDSMLRSLFKRSVIILVAILVPSGIILTIFGPLVLNFFGKSYSAGGSSVMIILTIAGPAVAGYNLGTALLRIRRQIYSLLTINVLYATSIILLTIYWVDKGLVWVAIAWTIGNTVAAILAFLSIFLYRQNPTTIELNK